MTMSFNVFAERPGKWASAEVLVSTSAVSSGRTGVRVDGQVIYDPGRPDVESIGTGVRRIEVRVEDNVPAHILKSATLRGSSAGHIAQKLDALPRDTRGEHGCPAEHGLSITLTVLTATAVFVVSDDPGCDSVGVTRDGRRLSGVLDDGLARLVEQATGLPELR